MPRQPRLDAPGLLQHVIAGGIERRKIFKDDHDKENFLTRLALILNETQTQCYAWALIPNHFSSPASHWSYATQQGHASPYDRLRRYLQQTP